MNAKYEFVPGDEKVIAPGRTVKRVRLLVAIAALRLPAGSLGGYVESEKNLSVSGDAWVYGDALIFWASKVGTANGTLTVFPGKDGHLYATRGCFLGTLDEFLAKSEAEHDDQTHLEYRLLLEVAHSRITRSMASLDYEAMGNAMQELCGAHGAQWGAWLAVKVPMFGKPTGELVRHAEQLGMDLS